MKAFVRTWQLLVRFSERTFDRLNIEMQFISNRYFLLPQLLTLPMNFLWWFLKKYKKGDIYKVNYNLKSQIYT